MVTVWFMTTEPVRGLMITLATVFAGRTSRSSNPPQESYPEDRVLGCSHADEPSVYGLCGARTDLTVDHLDDPLGRTEVGRRHLVMDERPLSKSCRHLALDRGTADYTPRRKMVHHHLAPAAAAPAPPTSRFPCACA
jgi:hypothetical protein